MARAPAVQEVEALPEADRLDEFPHPRHTRTLFGHEGVEAEMAQAMAGGRMHHAWLLAGREGIGKATLAYRLARHVLARPEERDVLGQSLEVAEATTAARQVGALSHPGLLLLRRL
jgi:DNA polymerase-3 subunit delta'